MSGGKLHRRRSSEDESLVVITPPPESISSLPLPSSSSPTRTRHQRNASISGLPLNISSSPMSAGPYRTSYQTPLSPFRTSFGTPHHRTRSVSSPFSPSLPSPLSTSTSFADQIPERPPAPIIPTSHSAPSQVQLPESADVESGIPTTRRSHARIHSRNLSVFFPRPGSTPQPMTIDEDGAQEIEVPPTLGAGFTFGKTPPGIQPPPKPPSGTATRRGHHHKHSVSHTFFSFLEPQPTSEADTLVTQPTPTPMSPWMPISPFVPETLTTPTFNAENGRQETNSPTSYFVAAIAQFFIGATLWVQGQQRGTLAVTALGYWAVFDAIGIAVPHVTFPSVSKPYGAARAQPVLLFAQSVYLMFSAVYVCKEALEHLLLSASAGDGHHHHTGDEFDGIEFPLLTVFVALFAFATSGILVDNHARLVSLADNRIPPLRALLSSQSVSMSEPSSPFVRALSNPYCLVPLALNLGILIVTTILPTTQHRPFDLGLAGATSAATFNAAYHACTVLGTILLQTAPRRGLPGGKMETFLRTMRDIERHPQVLHLPAPHIWQLAASSNKIDEFVVTMELHVAATLPDDDVFMLTKWVRDRVTAALGGSQLGREAEVTVGVVRG
ncbi:hypothetical protein MIND_00942000 [Mycena indigotica]|uniref:Uncharacterized protein n=1 Tax=Mycena indigotica TaxID=2126181 RepID=A0A8H6VZ18_9AGAR|nr:uncharacterized protein MIND_00942000 [Mycena indigotica]KAF7297091.1 hypothetical protein MIND_00942000 [Mycena indigotica]